MAIGTNSHEATVVDGKVGCVGCPLNAVRKIPLNAAWVDSRDQKLA